MRRASEDDIDFMKKYEQSKKKKREVLTLPQLKGGKGTIASVTTVYKKKGQYDLFQFQLPLYMTLLF